jgi:hypothetical protein
MPRIPLFILTDEARMHVENGNASHGSYEAVEALILPEVPEPLASDLNSTDWAKELAKYHLLRDLARAGWRGRLSKADSGEAIITLMEPNLPLSKQQMRQAMEYRRTGLIRQNSSWIRRVESAIMNYFVDGTNISPMLISPELEECESQMQHDVFRYCRFLSSVPYSEYVGRRMHFLIRDASLPSRPVMGIAALGSSLLQIRARDEWIGWHTGELRGVKKIRIANVMDLYVAISIPPYNDLLGGKLTCYMMASNEVRSAFSAKYFNKATLGKKRIARDLALIVTTSVYGQHSSQYNRLRYKGELLYIPVGETAGFGTWHIGEETFTALRKFLSMDGSDLSHKFGDGANWRFRVVREGMDQLGFPSDECLRHGHSRGVYAAPLASNCRQFLCGNTDTIEYFDYPLQDLVSFWRERWLAMRARNPDVMRRVTQFKANSLRLTQSFKDRM